MTYPITPALRPNDAQQPVISRERAATSFVRTHAILTGDMSSIQLVRALRDANTSELEYEATTAFHLWAHRLHLGRPAA